MLPLLRDLLQPHSMKPWPMDPHALANLLQHGEGVEGMIAPTAGPRLATKVEGAVAVIHLEGVIVPWKAEAFADAVLAAVNTDTVGAIVMAVDSPGGVITGVPEAADAILSARGKKPIIALTTGINASAAYWLSSTADKVISTPSGYTGSIGVWTAHLDVSKALETFGVKVSLISAGKHKVDGNMFEPLGDEARAHMQENVDDCYGMFLDAVATHRGVSAGKVRAGYGEGRVLNAERALEAGLIDKVGTMETLVQQLRGPTGRNTQAMLRKLDLDAA